MTKRYACVFAVWTITNMAFSGFASKQLLDEWLWNLRRFLRYSMTSVVGWYIRPQLANVFCLSVLIDFFEVVGTTLASLGKLSRMSNFLFKKRCFRKTLFCHTTTYSRLCSSEYTCMKNLILAVFFDPGRDLLRNKLGSIGHLQKLC